MATYVKEMISKFGNVFKNMVGEIVRQCHNKNIDLSSDVIAYAAILYFINPLCGVKDPDNITRPDIDVFVENCVSRLSRVNAPDIKSFQLQFICFEMPLDVITVDARNVFEGKLTEKHAHLIKEISETPSRDTDNKDLFKKIAFDIIISNRLGKPNTGKTVVEVLNALKSVLSPDEFHDFLLLTKKNRIERLKELRLLVCGIMIYNRWEGEVGQEMRDIIKDVFTFYKKIKNSIVEACESSLKNVRRFQNARKKLYKINLENNDIEYKHKNVHEIKELTSLMHLYVQYGTYLNKLYILTIKQGKGIARLKENWYELLSKVQELVVFRIPITTNLVFPHFIELSIIWHNLWEYLRIMITTNKLLDEMTSLFVPDNLLDIEAKFNYALNTKVIDHITTTHIYSAPFQLPDNCEWINYDPESEIAKNLTNIHSFCAYQFIVADTILIPSNLYLGLIKYNNLYYAFSNDKYLKPFTDNVQYFESKFMLLIRSNPHLINFFDMYDLIRNYKYTKTEDKKKIIEEFVEEKNKSIDIQTELHPIPFYKDKQYTWNVWDLRKKAVQLANLKHCVTHSSQTDATYYRYSTKLQTIAMKDADVVTKKDLSVDTQTDL